MARLPIELDSLVNSLEQHYAAMFIQMADAEALYNQDFAGVFQQFDYNVPVYRSSRATNIVDGFRNQIRTDEPTVRLQATNNSREAETQASLLIQWAYWALKLERERSLIDPNLQCAFDLLLRGAACKRILVDVNGLPDEPQGEAEHRRWQAGLLSYWPYNVQAIDPLRVLPSPGTRRPLKYIVEKQRRWLEDVRQEYPRWTDPRAPQKDAENPARVVEVLQCWSEQDYVVRADGERVVERVNPYGLVPYIYEFSGLGRQHADANPEHLAVGILTRREGAIQKYVELMTALTVQAMMHVFPTVLTTEDATAMASKFSVGPGRIITHKPGQPPTFMQAPPPNENIHRLLVQVESELADLSSEALQGLRPEGVQYGIHQAQLTGQALTHIRQIRATLERMAGQTLDMMVREAYILNLTMGVKNTASRAGQPKLVKPKDFQQQGFEVTLEVVDPAENDRRMLVGEAVRRAGDISRRSYWEHYMQHVIDDPDEEEVRLLTEQLLQQMVQSGQLLPIVLAEDVAKQVETEAEEGQATAKKVVQQRRSETVPEVAGALAREMETLAGTPGGLGVPQEVAEEALRGSEGAL